MAKILLVEDEPGLAGAVKNWLGDDHHSVDIALSGRESLLKLGSAHYDLLLLDWLLPELSGIEICRNYRQSGGIAPVLMLTAKGSVSDKEMGLDNGADDYMTKPFHLRELSARIRALLRRPPRERFSCLRAGEIELNPIAITVTKSGQASSLLPKEFILLATLLRNKDRIMTISDLLDQVWGQQSHVSPATLRSNIKSLRRKIDTAGKPSSIITLHGIGYKIGGSQTY